MSNGSQYSTSPQSPVVWENIPTSGGPALAFHTGCVFQKNQLIVHGGLSHANEKQPCNSLYRICLESKTWTNLTTDDSPYLSQHASVVFKDRYFVLIGGWNGRERTCEVNVYDISESQWLSGVTSVGFPEGGGLSAHSANLLSGDELTVLILGREGGLRQQRKSGNSFLLRGDLKTKRFVYSEAHVGADSRSYHCAVATSSKDLYVTGGRADRMLDHHTISGRLVVQPSCSLVERLTKQISSAFATSGTASSVGGRRMSTDSVGGKSISSVSSRRATLPSSTGGNMNFPASMRPLKLRPPGRKGHCTLVGMRGTDNVSFLICGGETFDGLNRPPVKNALFIAADEENLTMFDVGDCRLVRAYGVACMESPRGCAWYHGGVDESRAATSDLWKLVLP